MNTSLTFLMYKASGSTYEKLVDIKDYPDFLAAPEMLESTTLSDIAKTYEPGLIDTPSDGFPFTVPYSSADYDKIVALKDQELDLAIWFGGTVAGGVTTPTGSDGKFQFKGKVSAALIGKGTSELREMSVIVAPSTYPEKVAA